MVNTEWEMRGTGKKAAGETALSKVEKYDAIKAAIEWKRQVRLPQWQSEKNLGKSVPNMLR